MYLYTILPLQVRRSHGHWVCHLRYGLSIKKSEVGGGVEVKTSGVTGNKERQTGTHR